MTGQRALGFGQEAQRRAAARGSGIGQTHQRGFRRTGQAADRVQIARIGDQHGMGQRGEAGTGLSAAGDG